ncbi:hypothetical protein B0181_03020 [Moraxella caviae]|uniref:Lipoprotein n=1 Tax=Moraxella caviae TaxID=34060 RepID=A0A1T0A890_9GAMM|nr:hypothetical protein [Moraxella caviae]OOR91541.1 hypothetical protein B0181_03020 [Moraxella caviae]STZ14374.1 Uncharacterised protein [Moraxella caviae]VEW12819.1 Uncharacterised protein [Moraxella caviae]
MFQKFSRKTALKTLAVGALASTLLAGCASTTGNEGASGIAASIFKQAVDHQCRSQLNANQTYKVVTSFMGSESKAKLESEVCGCVSEKAPQSVSLNEVAQAALDSNARTQIVGKAVSNTLQACVAQWVS